VRSRALSQTAHGFVRSLRRWISCSAGEESRRAVEILVSRKRGDLRPFRQRDVNFFFRRPRRRQYQILRTCAGAGKGCDIRSRHPGRAERYDSLGLDRVERTLKVHAYATGKDFSSMNGNAIHLHTGEDLGQFPTKHVQLAVRVWQDRGAVRVRLHRVLWLSR